jgi:hypothetical protein
MNLKGYQENGFRMGTKEDKALALQEGQSSWIK